MKRIETSEFSIEAHPMFDSVRVFSSEIELEQNPGTFCAPRMSMTTLEPHQSSLEEWMANMFCDNERKMIAFSGMHGEMAKVKSTRENYETREEKDWFHFVAVLVSSDATTWYRADAWSSGDDLPVIENAFERFLDSIHVKLTGDAAKKARAPREDETKAYVEEQKRLEKERYESLEQKNKIWNVHVKTDEKDIETRFEKAVISAGLADKRDVLRQIVIPTISLTEMGEASVESTGQSRIGGGPDLPEGMEWPRYDSAFHSNFLAQINLADLPAFHENLPKTGLLSFFTGMDYDGSKVFYTPANAPLIAHALPENAETMARAAYYYVNWDDIQKRYIAGKTSQEGLSVETDENGQLTFMQDGKVVLAFASEYEISQSSQLLRLEPSLSTPSCDYGDEPPPIYAKAGLDEPFDFYMALKENVAIGEGPQHQMFGVIADMEDCQEKAARYAAEQGCADIAKPEDWFLLLKLASGGKANFCFGDYGDYVFMANRKDVAKSDFSRIYAFLISS